MQAIEKSGIQTHEELEQQAFARDLLQAQDEISRIHSFAEALVRVAEAEEGEWFGTIGEAIQELAINVLDKLIRVETELNHLLEDDK